ncbi:hypothetical protein JKP75_14440 [Blastococcus sp. TML/M2B]|uniref:hypothetical protein n=1 Tax=unclassified Blastococcus TaxID=2619396 RepID=UPI001909E9CC|nr:MULTISPECIES: hypothetical protein [unclassified Blastococcus]MBN1093648.1 hypothetical protein [Blastococcus sp. TML/M2B]MBN1096233.1 hypothetical protein [Blastococcus sp. TML/C7B]
MPSSPLPPSAAEPEVLRLSPSGRRRRLSAVLIVLGLLLAGTVWGDDDAFPFGPFRMYSTRNDPNAPVISTRAVGVTAAGEEIKLSGGQVGLRRAEFEGQIQRLRAHPELLGLLADAWTEDHPDAPELVAVQVVHRKFGLSDGRPTGDYTDTVVVHLDLEDDGS